MSSSVSAGREPSVSGVIRETRDLLRRLAPGLSEPDREARDLVSALLDVPPSWVALNGAGAIESPVRERVMMAAVRRAAGAPLAYAVGLAWFRHLTLEVDERVLIPRPETELLVDLVLENLPETGGSAVDVGTGSGAIALSLAVEGTGRLRRIVGTDVSRDALDVARRNAERLRSRLRVNVELVEGSLLAPVADERFDAVVSNPPYIAGGEAAELPPDVRNWEPSVALFGGADGLAVLRPLVGQAAGVLRDGGLLALEVDARRARTAADLVREDARYEHVEVHKDLTGRERFVLARRKEGR